MRLLLRGAIQSSLMVFFSVSIIIALRCGNGLKLADLTNRYPIVDSCAPTISASGYNLPVSSLQYSTASTNNLLNLYTPPTGGNWPLVVWIHGPGLDQMGLLYKLSYSLNDVILYLISQGYAVGSLEYRASTQLKNPAKLPAQVQDVRCGLMWLKGNAPQYNVNPTNTVVIGEAGSGMLAGLLAMNFENGGQFDDPAHCSAYPGDATVASAVLYDPAVDIRSSANFGTASIAGGACTTALDCMISALGSTPEANPSLAATVSPITYLSTKTIPILINYSSPNLSIYPAPIQEFVGAIRNFNRPITYVEIEGAAPSFLHSSSPAYWAGKAPYGPSMCSTLNFIRETSSGR